MLTVYLTTIGRSIPSHYFHSTSSQSTAASRFPRRNPHTIRINYVDLVEARKIFQVTITFFVDCYRTTSRMFLSHGQTQGVTVQPWADTRGQSKYSHGQTQGVKDSTAMGRHKGSQYSHGQTQAVTVQPWADTGGHSTALGRHKRSQYSPGQTQGVTVQPWADTGGHTVQPWADTSGQRTAIGRQKRSKYSHVPRALLTYKFHRRRSWPQQFQAKKV